jgi:ubiquinone/menaquinone biosynthesis C-methylase UbiE
LYRGKFLRAKEAYRLQKTLYDGELQSKSAAIKDYYQEWRKSYFKRIQRTLKIDPNNIFLDIGVGSTGYTIVEIAKMGAKAVGVDISTKGIKIAYRLAKEMLSEKRELWDFVVCSGEYLPFRRIFSGIISIAVIEHIPYVKKVFDEISRVIKIFGKVFIVFPNKNRPFTLGLLYKVIDRKQGHLWLFDPRYVVDEFRRRGFNIEDIRYSCHSIKLLHALFRLARSPAGSGRVGRNFWWKIEELDLRQPQKKSLAFTIVATKRQLGKI